MPPFDDGVLRRLVEQIRAVSGYLGDGDRHRRVVGPLTGFPAAAADHGDLEPGAAGGLKLIRRTQRVTGGRGQQHTLDAVIS